MVASASPVTPAASTPAVSISAAAAPPPCYVGSDVSKGWVDLADTAGRRAHADNTVAALTAVLSAAPWRDCAGLVCEATGGPHPEPVEG